MSYHVREPFDDPLAVDPWLCHFAPIVDIECFNDGSGQEVPRGRRDQAVLWRNAELAPVRAVYGISLAVGFVALLAWVAAVFASGSVDGWESFDLERRFGVIGRRVVAAVLGFGMAGLSASYAGWNTALAILAALAGAVVAVALAGPTSVRD